MNKTTTQITFKPSEWEISKCSCCGLIDMYYNPVTKENYTLSEIEDIIELQKESEQITTFKAVLDTLFWIVQAFNYRVINGILIDVQTANTILSVHNAVNDENKAKLETIFNKHGIEAIGSICWKMITKASI